MSTALIRQVSALPDRWYPLRKVPEQMGYVLSPHRFNVLPAGRRSGKTERFKRKLVRRALSGEGVKHTHATRYFAAAPTRDQAKRIYWDDLKALSKPWWAFRPAETSLTITLLNDAQLQVLGMDQPQRIEGTPWDGGGLDEYANMKPEALGANVLPALSDREGWLDLLGVPEGRNHYYDTYKIALASMRTFGAASPWGAFTWFSSAVLPAAEIALMRATLDGNTFEQEYEAAFVNFEGRAYYGFTDANQAALVQNYNPRGVLILCLDFNVQPGVGVICQELPLPNGQVDVTKMIGTAVIGEIWIENNSNTNKVCKRFLKDWGQHPGRVEVYGDASGGARGTSKVAGSDWDLVKKYLRDGDNEFHGFGDRVSFHIKSANPAERARLNAMNTRIRSSENVMKLMVDGSEAPKTVKDLEGVVLVKGGSGEIDYDDNKMLTHLSSGLGYYVEYRFPIVGEPGVYGSTKFKL